MKRHFISARVASHFRYILLSGIWSAQHICTALIVVCWALAGEVTGIVAVTMSGDDAELVMLGVYNPWNMLGHLSRASHIINLGIDSVELDDEGE